MTQDQAERARREYVAWKIADRYALPFEGKLELRRFIEAALADEARRALAEYKIAMHAVCLVSDCDCECRTCQGARTARDGEGR